MSVTLLQLRALAAVVETGGFAAAADHLGLTQSAVSHALASLEHEVHGKVVTRRPRVNLTALGRQILPHAQVALTAAEAIESNARSHGDNAIGEVRLGTVRTVSYGLIPQLLQSWRTAYPGIKVRLFEGDDDELPMWLAAGMIDAALLVDSISMPNINLPAAAVSLGVDRYAAVLPSDHPLATETVIHPVDLVDDPMILSDSGCAPYVERIMRSVDPDFRPVSVVRDAGSLLAMVAAGVGICMLPEIGRAMLPKGLVMVPLDPSEERELFFTGPTNRDWIPPVLTLTEHCRQHPIQFEGLSAPSSAYLSPALAR